MDGSIGKNEKFAKNSYVCDLYAHLCICLENFSKVAIGWFRDYNEDREFFQTINWGML